MEAEHLTIFEILAFGGPLQPLEALSVVGSHAANMHLVTAKQKSRALGDAFPM